MAATRNEAVLRVLCSESELQEYGEIIRVGQVVRRQAGRREGTFYGDLLDEVEWRFDQYAQVVGYDAAMISGQVTAISAVYVQLQQQPDSTWAPRAGTAHLEELESTADTRQVEEEFGLGESFPDGRGGVWASRVPMRRDGDECLTGWVFSLKDTKLEALSAT